MLLCDIGNTSYHFLQIAESESSQTSYKESVKAFDPSTLHQEVFYICVNSKIQKELEQLGNWKNLGERINSEKYYETMGIDRVFACEAVDDGVIIDAGSAITVDVVDEGVFQGGFIYPGTKAMHKCYEDISPALAYDFNYALDTKQLAKNSQDAISYGYLKLLHNEVLSHQKKIYLTGGDATKLQNLFPEAIVNECLIFDGMRKIISQGL